MLSLTKLASTLRSWEHVQKFTRGNVELELAVSTLVLEAIALGQKREYERANEEAAKKRLEIRELSARSRKNGMAEGIATRSDVAISLQEKPEI